MEKRKGNAELKDMPLPHAPVCTKFGIGVAYIPRQLRFCEYTNSVWTTHGPFDHLDGRVAAPELEIPFGLDSHNDLDSLNLLLLNLLPYFLLLTWLHNKR